MSSPRGADGAGLTSIPPSDQDAERAVLGALFLYGEPRWVKGLVSRGLRAEDFYWERHAQIFGAVTELAKRESFIDPVTVAGELEQQLGRAVDAQQIEELASYAPSAGGLSEYADIVINLAYWRQRRRLAQEMLTAIETRDLEAWKRITRVFERVDEARGQPTQPRLRLVVDGDTGEMIERREECPECKAFEDQLAGAEKEIRAWRSRYANLLKEREKEDKKDAIWLHAQALFALWQRETGHKRSPWSYKRFLECEPYLRKYEVQMVERAIAGMVHDPWVRHRRNGTPYRRDWWEDLFYSHKAFENYANSAPLDWKPKLKITIEVDPEEQQEQELQMTLIEGTG